MSKEKEISSSFKWKTPQEVMQLHQLKRKKKALQARINSTSKKKSESSSYDCPSQFENIIDSTKRRNPFISKSDSKKIKIDVPSIEAEESTDQTLFKLLHLTSSSSSVKENLNFTNILNNHEEETKDEIVKAAGEKWIPIDWCMKTKLRFMSLKQFPWNQKLKVSEEASGITSFVRCLDTSSSETSLDTSPNAKFHQCCLYWQHPSIPWLQMFPRITGKVSACNTIVNSLEIKENLHSTWSDSLRSLFQLLRTRQCPYFYLCADNFTALFRASGICGFLETHALITPTTRGFRNLLRQEDIEFTMPLKISKLTDTNKDIEKTKNDNTEEKEERNIDEDEQPDEKWLESMGINVEDIKHINYTQVMFENY